MEGPADRACAELGSADYGGPKFDINMLIALLRQENARCVHVIKFAPEMKYIFYSCWDFFPTLTCHGLLFCYTMKMKRYLKCKSKLHVKY